MTIHDFIFLVVFVGFGLWWLLFPYSVSRFYKRVHNGKVKMGTPIMIRLIGLVWVVLMLWLKYFRKQ